MTKIFGFAVFVLLVGCDSSGISVPNVDFGVDAGAPDQASTPVVIKFSGPLLPLEECAENRGDLREIWQTNNSSVPVTAFAVSHDTVALAREDRRLDYWRLTNDAKQPIVFSSFPIVLSTMIHALTFQSGSSNLVLGVGENGSVQYWEDIAYHEEIKISDQPLYSIAGGYAMTVAAGKYSHGPLYVHSFFEENFMQLKPVATTVEQINAVGVIRRNVSTFVDIQTYFVAGLRNNDIAIESRFVDPTESVTKTWSDPSNHTPIFGLAVDTVDHPLIAVGHMENMGLVAAFAPGAVDNGPTAIQKVDGHRASHVILLSDREHFATVGEEGALRLWTIHKEHLRAGRSIAIPAAVGLGIDVDEFQLNQSSGRRLFTAGTDGALHAYGCVAE